MIIKLRPAKKYQQMYDQGYKCCVDGGSIDDNPYLTHSDLAKSSWWEAGYIRADEDLCMSISAENGGA